MIKVAKLTALDIKDNKDKTGVIYDPLGQTHSLTSSEHYFHATFVLFCDIWKVGTDGRTDGQHVWKRWSLPAVIVGFRVDQSY